MRKQIFALIILSMSILLSCATTGPGGKTSVIFIPVAQEVAIGEGMAQQVEHDEKILDDAEWQAYLNEVGQKIVKVSDRQDIQYQFKVIESDQINAFAAPGGYVYFYTGLLKVMENEAEMAAVMAHEISHVVARHSVKRIQAALGVALAYDLVFGSDGSSKALDAAINVGMGLTFASYSRSNEREADEFGLVYLVKAGYNPQGEVTMYEKLAAQGGGERSVFEQLASSHPETQERINNAKAEIEQLKPLPSNLTYNSDRYLKMRARLK